MTSVTQKEAELYALDDEIENRHVQALANAERAFQATDNLFSSLVSCVKKPPVSESELLPPLNLNDNNSFVTNKTKIRLQEAQLKRTAREAEMLKLRSNQNDINVKELKKEVRSTRIENKKLLQQNSTIEKDIARKIVENKKLSFDLSETVTSLHNFQAEVKRLEAKLLKAESHNFDQTAQLEKVKHQLAKLRLDTSVQEKKANEKATKVQSMVSKYQDNITLYKKQISELTKCLKKQQSLNKNLKCQLVHLQSQKMLNFVESESMDISQ